MINMGNCMSHRSKHQIGVKIKKNIQTSTHIDQKVFQLKLDNVKKVYKSSKKIDSPVIMDGSSDSDCDSGFFMSPYPCILYIPRSPTKSPMREMHLDSDSESQYNDSF